VVAEGHVVWRVGDRHRGLDSAEKPLDILWLGGISTQEPMLAEGPQIAGLRAWSPGRFFEGSVEVEVLLPFALFAGLQATEQVSDLVLAEACQRQVHLRVGLQIG
jgi:hypothetical protein